MESEPEAPPHDGRKIIHVDMDAFYASVEQRDNPDLRGKPVAVGGQTRGVVAAASYEARKYGVRSAMPSVTAMRQCPELIFVKPRFDAYKEVSRQIRAIFERYTPLVEPLSLDEAYLDVTENLKGMQLASEIAREIRTAILDETGLTASAGVSYNKFLAKVASDFNKPNGQTVIPPEKALAFLGVLPVAKFSGVGPATAAKLHGFGIITGGDLRVQTLEFLTKHFGKSGAWYFDLVRGVDRRAVRPDRERKSIGSETTFFQDLTTREAVEEALRGLCADVWRHCERSGARGRTLTLKLRYNDFTQLTRARTATARLSNCGEMEVVAIALADPLLPLGKPVRLLGVTLSNLREPPPGVEEAPAQFALDL
ncbi:MAG: DNA polymerase IV [Alphaproteobacteria bacterium]